MANPNRFLPCFLCQGNCEAENDEHSMIVWGRLLETDKVEIGMQGIFDIKNCPLTAKKKLETFDKTQIIPYYGTVCMHCLKEFELVPNLSVECSNCKKQFQQLFSECATQADGCAAVVKEDRIVGHYGSKFDSMSPYEDVTFVSKRPENLQLDSTICDECIQKFIDDGICNGQPMINYSSNVAIN